MSDQLSLRYPQAPGFRPVDTSRAAALAIRADAKTIRGKVIEVLRGRGPMTADEVAEVLGLSILTVRPRLTELKRMGRIEDTGHRRQNRSGKAAAVMCATTQNK